jgi:hypothetical protein
MAEMWKKVRTDEYMFSEKAIRMTKEKQKKTQELDCIILTNKRYV